MAIASFNKDFTLNTKKAVELFERIISTPNKSIKIDKSLVSAEKEQQGKKKIKQILSR
ncbi:MAG: hypothetical protein ACOCXB_02545 [Halanaerobium sp.]